MRVDMTVSTECLNHDMEVMTDRQTFDMSVDTAVKIASDPYQGSYEVTPTRYQQTLPVTGMSMTQDVIVHPIPPNYGLVTWDGSVLTVS